MTTVTESRIKDQEQNLKSEEKSTFRADIAGLRAVAVILVLLCHFEIPGFSGGFIGPDIFFVISGFLITGILVKEYAKSVTSSSRGKTDSETATRKSRKSRRGKISFTNFYLRRARRILPAALLVLFFINLYAVASLNILQQAQIQTDSIWTLLFLSNINFLRQSMDYFAQGSDVSPLQHYWTLAVEEQFYLVWPTLFIAATRLNGLKIFGRKIRWRDRVFGAMVLVFIASTIWLLLEFSEDPLGSYFSTFSRTWELAFGGILGFLVVAKPETRIKITSPAVRLISLCVLICSVALVSPNNFGHTLFVPVLATGILLLSGADQSADLTTRILSNRVLIYLGAISYSLYLWHWPVYVFGRQLGLMDNLGQRVAGIALSIILAAFSYRYVELKFMQLNLPKPAKKKSGTKSKKTFFLPAMTAGLMISVIGVFTYSNSSFVISGIQATPWFPTIGQNPGLSSPSGSVAASPTSFLPEWTTKIQAGMSLKAVPSELTSQLARTQILNYPWKTQMKCRPDSALPAKSDGMATTYCQTKAVPNGKKLVVLGDSFAGSLMPAVLNSVDLSKWQVISLFRLECMWSDVTPVSYKSGLALNGCPIARNWMTKEIEKIQPDLLILTEESVHKISASKGKRLDVWASGVDNSLKKFETSSKKILIVGMHPGVPPGGLSKCLGKGNTLTPTCFGDSRMNSEYRSIQAEVSKKHSLGYLDLTPWLCVYGKCPPIIDSKIVYADSFHFTPMFATSLAPALTEAYNQQNLN